MFGSSKRDGRDITCFFIRKFIYLGLGIFHGNELRVFRTFSVSIKIDIGPLAYIIIQPDKKSYITFPVFSREFEASLLFPNLSYFKNSKNMNFFEFLKNEKVRDTGQVARSHPTKRANELTSGPSTAEVRSINRTNNSPPDRVMDASSRF